jgi:anti-anti-sigma factor
MTIETSRHGKAALVTVSGRLDATTAAQFEQACRDSLTEGVTHLVVDLTDLEYTNSLGLRTFVALGKRLQGAGGALVLCGMKGLVKEVFDMTHLTPIFRTFDTADAALASL